MGSCQVCEGDSTTKCGRCKAAYYCSTDHQKVDWRGHKKSCQKVKTARSENKENNKNAEPRIRSSPRPFDEESPSGWMKSVPANDHYEWLSNCYQLRCDDDYAYGGCYLHGPYDPEGNARTIEQDFMAFCLMAKRTRVVPANWNWAGFLARAGNWVGFALEKSDVVERWGAFVPMVMRIAAEHLYDSAFTAQDFTSLGQRIAEKHAEKSMHQNSYVTQVGGKTAWSVFRKVLKSKRIHNPSYRF